VLDRFTGLEVAKVPAPSRGLLLPFSIRVPSPGHLVVLDSGGFPNPNVPSIARVYDCDYELDPLTHCFSAGLTRTVSFAHKDWEEHTESSHQVAPAFPILKTPRHRVPSFSTDKAGADPRSSPLVPDQRDGLEFQDTRAAAQGLRAAVFATLTYVLGDEMCWICLTLIHNPRAIASNPLLPYPCKKHDILA
jgi:hypothetical protein